VTRSIAARAVVFTAIGDVSRADVTVPTPGPGEVLVETAFSAISPGTERRCLAGKQEGAPPFPYVPGYALTGQVQEAGPGVALPVGTRVFCSGTRRVDGANRLWGGHISHAVLPADNVLVLPETLPLADAALIRLAAIAYHGLRLARPLPHETVAVVGLGVIGTLAARLYQGAGCAVLGVDPIASRRQRLSLAVASIAEAQALLPDGAAIVVDATGAPSVLEEALTLAHSLSFDDSLEPGARLVIQGSYPETVPLAYHSLFMKEMTVLTPRNCQPRDEKAVLSLLARGSLRVTDLYEISPYTEVPATYANLGGPEAPATILFDWRV